MVIDLTKPTTQAAFAEMVGVDPSTVSRWVSDGVLLEGGTAGDWLHAYCGRLREQAAGRYSEGPFDLSQERAMLAREQRLTVRSKRLEFEKRLAPTELMTRVAAETAVAASEAFDHMRANLRRQFALPADVLDLIDRHVVQARNAMADQFETTLFGLVGSDKLNEVDVGEDDDEDEEDRAA